MRKIFICILLTVCCVGCSGRLIMMNISPEEIQEPGWSADGVIVYPLAWFLEQSKTTKLTNKDGKTIGTELDGTCTPVLVQKLALHADMSRPRLIKYEHGLLESYTLGVTVGDEGSLKTVNLTSTPDQGNTIKNLATAASSIAGIVGEPLPGQPQSCNDGLALIGLKRYEFPH